MKKIAVFILGGLASFLDTAMGMEQKENIRINPAAVHINHQHFEKPEFHDPVFLEKKSIIINQEPGSIRDAAQKGLLGGVQSSVAGLTQIPAATLQDLITKKLIRFLNLDEGLTALKIAELAHENRKECEELLRRVVSASQGLFETPEDQEIYKKMLCTIYSADYYKKLSLEQAGLKAIELLNIIQTKDRIEELIKLDKAYNYVIVGYHDQNKENPIPQLKPQNEYDPRFLEQATKESELIKKILINMVLSKSYTESMQEIGKSAYAHMPNKTTLAKGAKITAVAAGTTGLIFGGCVLKYLTNWDFNLKDL